MLYTSYNQIALLALEIFQLCRLTTCVALHLTLFLMNNSYYGVFQVYVLHSLPFNIVEQDLKQDIPSTKDDTVTSILESAKQAISQPENPKLREIVKAYTATQSSILPKSDLNLNPPLQPTLDDLALIPINLDSTHSDHTVIGKPPYRPRPTPMPPISIPHDVEVFGPGGFPSHYPPRPYPINPSENPVAFPSHDADAEFVRLAPGRLHPGYRSKQAAEEVSNVTSEDAESRKKNPETSTDLISEESYIRLFNDKYNYDASIKIIHDKQNRSKVCYYQDNWNTTTKEPSIICFHFSRAGEKPTPKTFPTVLNKTHLESGVEKTLAKAEKLIAEVKNTESDTSTKKIENNEAKPAHKPVSITQEDSTSSEDNRTTGDSLEAQKSFSMITKDSSHTILGDNKTNGNSLKQQNSLPVSMKEEHVKQKSTASDSRATGDTKDTQIEVARSAEKNVGAARSKDDSENDSAEGGPSADAGRTIKKQSMVPVNSTTERNSDHNELEKKSTLNEQPKLAEKDSEMADRWKAIVSDLIKQLRNQEIQSPSNIFQNEYNLKLVPRMVLMPYNSEEDFLDSTFDERMASLGEEEYFEEPSYV